MDSIQTFFADKVVLITGGTGFLGKVLLEKLLRSCRTVKRIYLLTRSRADHTPQQRIDNMLQTRLFQNVRENDPDQLDKVTAITGDIAEADLGLSPEDMALIIGSVQIVFHSAATVRFDEELRVSLQLNVKGTQEVIRLCKATKKLEAFVHVSSTYANCDRDVVDEKIYPPSIEPEKLISSLEWMSDDMVKAITPYVIDQRPNTYTFTKSLAEHVLLQEASGLPVSIFRPSIIGASFKEPLPGWVDNFNGPAGLFVAAGKGMLRSMPGDLNSVGDVIPVDIAAHMMICIAWHTAQKRSDGIPVYNCGTGVLNPITWGEISEIMHKTFSIYPMEDVFRRPNFNFESSKLMYYYWTYISHRIPALIADMLSIFIGQKPKMNRLYRKLQKATDVMKVFTSREWKFTTVNYLKLLEELSPQDQEEFGFDVRVIDWNKYFEDFTIGMKQFLLKEDLKNVHLAHNRIRKLRNIRWTMYAVLFVLFSWLLIKKVPSVRVASFRCLMRASAIFQALEPFKIVN
ncbi:fatty acyl-CoA reductase 1 [Nematostella vectensis]|uniref:fatty acyl-CoA reductase 1 n=1 Tax=Nematostella vectensis TaxID=45351 RepID=UPI002077398A|nr:fatty acyl-CoA reductase 1 [Nematostella vectensis]XP_048584996.1 fatty acyl-CoA reductase 1 [Nematostella vectensis]